MNRDPYTIKGPAQVLILSDIHVPFHDPDAILSAIAMGKEEGPISHVVVNGDLLDAYHLSSFEKDPKVRRFSEEVDMAVDILVGLSSTFKKARVVLKLGNHEARFDKYVRTNAPALADLVGLTLEDILRTRLPKIEIIEEWRNILVGDLLVNHGHEVGRGSGGAHPARWLLNKTGVPSLCGHFHRSDQYGQRNALGTLVQSWTTGALCQLAPDYLPRNNWNHGAAFVHVQRDGPFM